MNQPHCNNNNTRKIPNSATSATSNSIPNTIMLRDSDSSTRLSSIILRGADFVKSSVAAELLTKGFIYFASQTNNQYALLRNLDNGPGELNLSLDFGQNNSDGNFNIRTEQTTNFAVKNNRVGINTPNPQSTLDVNGSIRIRNLQAGQIYSNSLGELYAAESTPVQPTQPYHITDSSEEIPFDYPIIIFEVDIDIMLPTNKSDGYMVTLVNKSDGPIYIRSTEHMYNDLYLPMGGFLFVLDENRKIDAIYTKTNRGSSWAF
jgi:hypothetical protein